MKKLLALCLCLLTLAAAPANAAGKQSVFDRVMKAGTIRCGYAMWTPVLYKDMLNDPQYRIAALDGELTSILVRQTLPKASADAMPQTSDYAMLLKEVETKKADVTIVTPETFAEYDHNNPGKLKIANGGKAVNVFPASFGLPQNGLAFKRMIDVTLGELVHDGTVDRLLKKYEKYPGTFLRLAKPYNKTV